MSKSQTAKINIFLLVFLYRKKYVFARKHLKKNWFILLHFARKHFKKNLVYIVTFVLQFFCVASYSRCSNKAQAPTNPHIDMQSFNL